MFSYLSVPTYNNRFLSHMELCVDWGMRIAALANRMFVISLLRSEGWVVGTLLLPAIWFVAWRQHTQYYGEDLYLVLSMFRLKKVINLLSWKCKEFRITDLLLLCSLTSELSAWHVAENSLSLLVHVHENPQECIPGLKQYEFAVEVEFFLPYYIFELFKKEFKTFTP